MLAPYTQMAQSAILAIGVKLDVVPAQDVAYLQAGLIRLGFDPGRIDGVQGDKTTRALREAGANLSDPVDWLSDALKAKFPAGIRLAPGASPRCPLPIAKSQVRTPVPPCTRFSRIRLWHRDCTQGGFIPLGGVPCAR